MRDFRIAAVLLFGLFFVPSGCTQLSGNQEPPVTTADGTDHPQHHLSDPPPWNKDVEDPYKEVGDAARQSRPVEKDPDPWWQNWIMSGEARNIERNLGVDR